MTQKSIQNMYENLYKHYGPQGWWPLLSEAKRPGFDERGYHKNKYNYPTTNQQRFEIIVGTILTQNTSWKNVEKALKELKNIMSPEQILATPTHTLAELIRSSGYFNQKAERLKIVATFLQEQGWETLLSRKTEQLREQLLSLKGVGPETADSILLYAFNRDSFVVDAYTKRILSRIGLTQKKASYEEVKELIEKTLNAKHFNEFHALFVEHAKQFCKKKPDCNTCFLRDRCSFAKHNIY